MKGLEDFKSSMGAKVAALMSTNNAFKDELNHTMEEVAEL